jgi:hypothetical protein
MRLEIRDFKAEDILDIAEIHDPVLRELNCRRAVMIEKNPGPKYSAFLDGRCIGSGGAIWIHGRVYEVWVNATPELKRHKIAFHKLVLKLFADFKERYNWERIQASCVTTMEVNRAWAERLGFTWNGVVEQKAGADGSDIYRLSIVR